MFSNIAINGKVTNDMLKHVGEMHKVNPLHTNRLIGITGIIFMGIYVIYNIRQILDK